MKPPKADTKGLHRAAFMLYVQANRDTIGNNSDWWAWTHELTAADRRSWREEAREVINAYLGRNPRTGEWEVSA